MFKEVSQEIYDLLITTADLHPDSKIFEHVNNVPGRFSDQQFIRYNGETKQWQITIRVGYTQFKIPLTGKQARDILDGYEYTHICEIQTSSEM
jgi:hypothetical protein